VRAQLIGGCCTKVVLQTHDTTATRFNQRRSLFCRAPVEQSDIRASLSERNRRTLAEATRGAGDERYAPLQAEGIQNHV
jgi:hypothetical protein